MLVASKGPFASIAGQVKKAKGVTWEEVTRVSGFDNDWLLR